MISLYDKASPEIIAEVTKELQYDMNRRGEVGMPSRPQVNKYLVKMANLARCGDIDSYRVGSGLTWSYRNICKAHYKEFLDLYDFMESESHRQTKIKNLSADMDLLGEDTVSWTYAKYVLRPYGCAIRSFKTNMVKVQRWQDNGVHYFARSPHTLVKMNVRQSGDKRNVSAADIREMISKLEQVFNNNPHLHKI